MLASILAIFLASLITPFFYSRHRKLVATLLTILVAGIIIYFARFLPAVTQGESFTSSFAWLEALHIHLSFYLDGLSLFFALLIAGMGLLVLLYSFSYMQPYPQQGRFFCYLLFFMGSMLGVVLSANLISLFVFWELTSFSSFLLIGFNHQYEASRRSARQALLVTAGGGLALMAGFIFLELITNSGYSLIEIMNQSDLVVDHNLYQVALILIALGAFTKSAQFPFHFWLPNAMAAPTPVSAYLHSATMVKAGVYLVFRLNPVFSQSLLWGYLLGLVGAVTMTWGAFKALQEDDLKKILAYTTISALGIFFMMTGLGGEKAINAVIVYVLAHALYKGGLFLIAGNVDRQTGSRKLSQLSDLGKKMPYTTAAVMLSGASMAGLIPFLGFVGKESLYDVLYSAGNSWGTVYLILLFVASAFFTAVTIDIIYQAFFRKGELTQKPVNESRFLMVLAPLLLALAGLLAGIAPSYLAQPLLQWSAAAISQTAPSMSLKLWHGFNAVLLLSLLTFVAGAGLYFIRDGIKKIKKPDFLDADYLYDKTLTGIDGVARFFTDALQNGYLRNYIAMVLVSFCMLILAVSLRTDLMDHWAHVSLWKNLQIYEVVIIALITVAVVILFRTRSRLIVTATFGIIGYSIALAYTLFSAPDVAITQFLAETLTLILLILILHRLPSYTLKNLIEHKRYLPISLLFGGIMAGITFVMLHQETASKLKSFFLEQSIPQGKGQNAVNVILVDFRALDTLGEITVLAITMVGIIALLRINPKNI